MIRAEIVEREPTRDVSITENDEQWTGIKSNKNMPSEQLRYAVWIEDKRYFVCVCRVNVAYMYNCVVFRFHVWFNIWHTSHGRGETEFVSLSKHGEYRDTPKSHGLQYNDHDFG